MKKYFYLSLFFFSFLFFSCANPKIETPKPDNDSSAKTASADSWLLTIDVLDNIRELNELNNSYNLIR